MKSRPIFTPRCPTITLAFNIYSLLTSSLSSQVPFFFNHILLSRTSQRTTHARCIFSYMVYECRHNIRSQTVSTAIPSLNSFRDISKVGTYQPFGKILKDISFVCFEDIMARKKTEHTGKYYYIPS